MDPFHALAAAFHRDAIVLFRRQATRRNLPPTLALIMRPVGPVTCREIKDRPLKRDFLLPGDAYVLDVGTAGIWAWVGKKASPTERKNAMHYATQGFPGSFPRFPRTQPQ